MARIRTIKPDFWDSPATGKASLRARLLFIAMWNWADDFGIGDAHIGRLWNFAFPNDDPPELIMSGEPADIPPTFHRIPPEYAEIANLFGVIFYEHEGRPYYYIPSWSTHQKLDRRSVQKVPYPDDNTPALFGAIPRPPKSHRNPPTSHRNVGVGTEELGTEELGTTLKGERASDEAPRPRKKPASQGTRLPEGWQPSPESVEVIRTEFPSLDSRSEHKQFVDHWKSTPGAKGKKLDWEATWRNWMRRTGKEQARRGGYRNTADRQAAIMHTARAADQYHELHQQQAQRELEIQR